MAVKPTFELSQEVFDQFLFWLHPDREQAGIVFEQLRGRLRKLLLLQGCPGAEEVADETLFRVARRLAEGVRIESENPFTYIQGVARNVLREYWKSQERNVEGLADRPIFQPPATNPIQEIEKIEEQQTKERRLECLETCLQKLSPESRELFITYHQGALRERIATREKLAADLGIPMSSLRLRIHRIREKLETCINGCLTVRNIAERRK
ncbi:MAG: sigma-70 family RNA polymerase sigma factor [Blastocatellia bacterium]|nr:sigma-70 family RNA polymerase sigma factor [Blastocatellia bacterium]